MKHVKLFGGFLNEARFDGIGQLECAKEIAHVVFGSWDKGEYSTNQNYNYGGTYKFADGTTEKGYVSHSTTLTLQAPGIAIRPVGMDAKKEIEILFGGDAYKEKMYSANYVNVVVVDEVMITSKRRERKCYIYAGPRSGGNFKKNVGTKTVVVDDRDMRSVTKSAVDMKKEYMTRAKDIKGEDLVKMAFEDHAYGMLKVIKNEKSSSSRHQGIGSAASTKVHYDIKKQYDVKAYCDKYGTDKLKKIVADTYWGAKHVKSIENGVMYTDESWTDTYD